MSDAKPLIIVVDDGDQRFPELGTVDRLADLLKHGGLSDTYTVIKVYALGQDDVPTEVDWQTKTTPFNEDAWAYATVSVVFPDGTREESGFHVDGRA